MQGSRQPSIHVDTFQSKYFSAQSTGGGQNAGGLGVTPIQKQDSLPSGSGSKQPYQQFPIVIIFSCPNLYYNNMQFRLYRRKPKKSRAHILIQFLVEI